MANISNIATANPKYTYTNEQMLEAGNIWLKDNPEKLDLFHRLTKSAQIHNRSFALPLEVILNIEGQEYRANKFEELALPLCIEAVQKLFTKTKCGPDSIDTLIFCSCTSPLIPSIDAVLIEALELPRTIKRIPIFQQGCAGGMIGLELAANLSREGKKILVVSAELCSLSFHKGDFGGASILGAVLFGDGAAAALIEPITEGLYFIDNQSFLIPNSREIMGYDILDDGMHLRLESSIPKVISEVAPELVKTFLKKNNLYTADVKHWLFHPGGVKILNALEDGLDLNKSQTHYAWDVLTDHGNMSSATILFVIEKFIKENNFESGDCICIMGIGPGLTAELILLRNN
ncbi:MAG: hypothetical protein KBC84_08635 [Proteobacteria bacterium]|nr:hypothetical protein [Pseudomonadota bacterium]